MRPPVRLVSIGETGRMWAIVKRCRYVTFGIRCVRMQIVGSAADGMWWNNCGMGACVQLPAVSMCLLILCTVQVLRFWWRRGWGFKSTEMWRCVGGWLATDFSKNCRGFLFKEPEKSSHSDNGLLSVHHVVWWFEGECWGEYVGIRGTG